MEKYYELHKLLEAWPDEIIVASYNNPYKNISGKRNEKNMLKAEEDAAKGLCKLLVWRTEDKHNYQRFNNLMLQNYEWVENDVLNFDVLPTDELVHIVDEIRELNDCNDMAVNPNNGVWYSFYLDVHLKQRKVVLWASCNNGEKDDYAEYGIELTDEERQMLLWKAFRQYAKEVEK